MSVEPGTQPGVLVDGVIVEDDMGHLAGGEVGCDGIEKANELPMSTGCSSAFEKAGLWLLFDRKGLLPA
jgi:hypothetical protein